MMKWYKEIWDIRKRFTLTFFVAYVQFCLAFFLTLFSLVLAVICRSQQSERLLQGISLIMLLVTCLYALNPQGPLSTFVYFVIGG